MERYNDTTERRDDALELFCVERFFASFEALDPERPASLSDIRAYLVGCTRFASIKTARVCCTLLVDADEPGQTRGKQGAAYLLLALAKDDGGEVLQLALDHLPEIVRMQQPGVIVFGPILEPFDQKG